MAQIYETKNFNVESSERPLIPRADGGHIMIKIKDMSITDRTKLEPIVAIELMRLSMLIGESMGVAMNNRGIPIIKINYQDMGNWAYKKGDKPYLHYHIFGRSPQAIKQLWPESVYLPDRKTGFYEGFEPLNAGDVSEIQKQISLLEVQEKYQLKNWGLV